MPLYEFRCRACRKKYTVLVGMTAQPDVHACPHCGTTEADRLISRFGRLRSEDDRLDEIADRVEHMAMPDSAAEMRALAREMGKAVDEDVSGEMEEMLESGFEGGDEDL